MRTLRFASFKLSTSLNILLNAEFAFSMSIDSLISAHSTLFTLASFFSISSLNSFWSVLSPISRLSPTRSMSAQSLTILWSHAHYISSRVLLRNATSCLILFYTMVLVSRLGIICRNSSLSTFSFATFINCEFSALSVIKLACLLTIFASYFTLSSHTLSHASPSPPM